MADKYNYNPWILYDDQNIHSIINYEQIIHSDFVLRHNIKSLHIIDLDADSIRKSSIKYTYNRNKEIIQLTNYDEYLNEVMDRMFYNYSNYSGHYILKEGYSKLNPKKFIRYTSSNNPDYNLITLNTFENDVLIGIDSIHYQDLYLPTLIKKYNQFGELYTIYKFEYINNKPSLNLFTMPPGGGFGAKRVYDEYGRHLYFYKLLDINIETLDYIIDTTKNELVTYDNGNFTYYSQEDDIYFYNSINKCLSREMNSYQYKTYFNQNLMPISTEYVFLSDNKSKLIIFTYNDNGDLESRYFINPEPYEQSETFYYIYDSHNNWVERRCIHNKNLFKTTRRIIEYFE